jgi:hypothetical protein
VLSRTITAGENSAGTLIFPELAPVSLRYGMAFKIKVFFCIFVTGRRRIIRRK